MSIIRKKHGGAHGITHEKQTTTVLDDTGHGNKISRPILIEKSALGNVIHIQDGGHLAELSESQIQQLFFSEENSASIQLETALTVAPEWTKSTTDNVGAMCSSSTSQILGKTVTNSVPQEGSTTHVSSPTWMFCPVETDSTSQASVVSSSNIGANTAKIVANARSLLKNNGRVATTSDSSSLYGGRCDSRNGRQVAGLEDLQDVPSLDISDKEISKLDLSTIAQEQSTSLITSQDLAMLPDKALDFGESVASKSTLGDTSSELDNFVSSIGGDELESELAYLEQDGGIEKSVGNVNLDLFKNSSSTAKHSTNADKGDNAEAPPLATISISTDKASNTTQILINTGHGQQLFQINTADLAQATTALEPFALQGGMVGFDSNGQVLNTGTVNGITVQDGYLLIPVNQTDGESGVLLQTTALQSEDGEGEGIEGSSGAKKLYICEEDGCGKVFARLSKLRVHHMQHTGERPYKCNVPGCDWAFMTGYKLKRHLESHEKRKDFVCQEEGCGRKFTTIYNLNTHMKLHQRPNTEKCEICGEMFPTVRKLHVHMVHGHKDAEKVFKCLQKGCEKKFASSLLLQSHLKSHLKQREVICEFEGCGKKFDKQCRLKQHMRSHTGEKPYPCKVEGCGWRFATASKLKRHQAKHTGERKWNCPHEDCDKSFMRAEHLKGHLVTHTGEKPFFCTVPGCEARFAAKSSMYVHVKKHEQQIREGKVTYFCPMEGCERKYNNKNTLRQHISKHYQDTISQAQSMNLIQTGDMQESFVVPVTSVGGTTINADGSTSINPTDLINVGSQISATGGLSSGSEIVTNPTTVAQFIMTNELGQQLHQQQQHVQLSQNPRSLLANSPLLTASGGLIPSGGVITTTTSGVDSKPVITITPGEIENTEMLQGLSGGSARTDSYSNRMLSDRARRRRKLLRERAHLSNGGLRDEVLTAAAEYPTSEMLTSRGLPIRDPDTGALYVQTQLLQDDPPNVDMYTDESVRNEHQIAAEHLAVKTESKSVRRESFGLAYEDNSGLRNNMQSVAGVTNMDQSELNSDISLEVPPEFEAHTSDFAGSTINLQDLE